MSFSCWAEPQKMFAPNQITGPDPGIWDIYFIFSPSYGFDPGLFPLCNDGLHSWALSPGGILPLTRQNWIFCLVCVFLCTWHPGVCWSGHLICHLCGLCSWPQGIKINMSHKPLFEPQEELPEHKAYEYTVRNYQLLYGIERRVWFGFFSFQN